MTESARRRWRDRFKPQPAAPKHETWSCPICGRPVEMPSGGSMFQRQMGYYLGPGAPEIKRECGKQHGTHHGKFERSDLGMEGLEKRLDAMHEWLEHPPRPGEEAGCDFCRDDENRLYGFMTPVASNDETGMLLIRCPRCGTLYEKPMSRPDDTRPLTDEDARAQFPDAFPDV